MPTEAKQATVAELKEELSNSKATIVADYRGLTVSNISAVRPALRTDGIT
jgi:large subunit ribosomal protein L10